MRNELVNDSAREQQLIIELKVASEQAECLFAELRALMDLRTEGLRELLKLKSEMNDKMERGADEILNDIRAGKIGLVDIETGEPITITLFEKR